MTPVIIVLVVAAFILYAIVTCKKPANFPPGPVWLPFIGCSRIMAKACRKHGSQHKALSELAKQYSSQVLGFKLGQELVVAVLGVKNVKHVLTSEEFDGRPKNYFMKLRCMGKQIGITAVDGALWREHRQFTVKHLKNLGFGKKQMEAEILIELEHINEILKNNAKEVKLRSILAPAIMNILWKFTAGQNLREDRRLDRLLELLTSRSKAFNLSGGWLNQFPWIRFVAPDASGYSLICKINRELTEIIRDAIGKHEKGAIEGEDFMYAFLREIQTGKETYTKEQLTTVCLDLLIAGSQTSSNSLEFAFLMTLRKREAQLRIFNEIMNVCGDEIPCWDDHKRLPYTMAFLLEVQRFFSITPVIGPRSALKDSTIGGHFIPKNTTLLVHTHDVHHDPDLWQDPESFTPERFLDCHGNLKTSEHLYIFGLGRRRCPGDSLAKRFIFLLFVGIIQKFAIECTNGIVPPCAPICGLVLSPSPFTVDMRPRS